MAPNSILNSNSTRLALASLLLALAACGRLLAQDAPAAAPASGELPTGLAPDPLSVGLFPSGQIVLEDPPSLEGLDGRPPIQPPPSESVTVNLINRLVQKGILSQGDAADLMIQAQRDAEIAGQSAATVALVAEDMAKTTDDDVVVSYIPEPIKDRMQEEIKQQVMAQALAEGWAAPGMTPEWAQNMRFFADFRTRNDFTVFPDGNDATGSFPNFNAINRDIQPFDVSGVLFSPQRNVDENRNRHRIRVRFGADMDLGNGFLFGARLASGSDISPVSTNQTLGGDFQKYQIWLDQAFLRWETVQPSTTLRASAGRMPNPFFRTSVIMWDDDLNFDGLAFNLDHKLNERFSPFVNAGIFPVFTTAFDQPLNSPDKTDTINKWLQAIQLGTKINGDDGDVSAQIGAGLFHFSNVEGQLSDPFVPLVFNDAGSTDDRRPTFAQKGNTYMALRNILPDPLNDFGASKQWQYFGLASKYQILAYNARIDFDFFEPFQISILGDISTNLAYEQEDIESVAVNNRGPVADGQPQGRHDGGANAWNLGVRVGPPALTKKGDWDAHAGYRFIETDAVIDGFNDSAFGLGGTNMEGFTIGAGVAVAPKVTLNLRWLGASEITGPPLKSDIIQLDLNAHF
jgi:hypothetical protein